MDQQFHERVYTVRRRLGITQQQAADKAGVSLSAWKNWESGASIPRMDALLAIARVLQVSPNELTGWNEE